MVGAGGVTAFLVVAAFGLWPGLAASAQNRSAPVRARIRCDCGGAGFLLAAAELCRSTICDHARAVAHGRQRPESSSAISRDGNPSAHALSRICGLHSPICILLERAGDEVSRRQVDPHHAPLDDGDLGLPDSWHPTGRALGLLCAWLGWLLGMGPGRERLADAVAHGHSFSALGHDAREARHAEDLEHVVDLHDVHALDLRYISHPQRRGEFSARIRAIIYWRLVRRFPVDHFGRLRLLLLEKSGSPEERA